MRMRLKAVSSGCGRRLSQLTRPLAAVVAMKSQAEHLLDLCRADVVIHNKCSDAGITDLSLESRETEDKGKQRAVSIYFKMDHEGIRAYRDAAKSLTNNPHVELSYTPHFGQSRITFQWEYFWSTVNSSTFRIMSSNTLLQLEQGREPAKDETGS